MSNHLCISDSYCGTVKQDSWSNETVCSDAKHQKLKSTKLCFRKLILQIHRHQTWPVYSLLYSQQGSDKQVCQFMQMDDQYVNTSPYFRNNLICITLVSHYCYTGILSCQAKPCKCNKCNEQKIHSVQTKRFLRKIFMNYVHRYVRRAKQMQKYGCWFCGLPFIIHEQHNIKRSFLAFSYRKCRRRKQLEECSSILVTS